MISRWIFLRMRNVPDKYFAEKIDKNDLYPNIFFPLFSENRTVYETMLTNTVEPDRTQMTIWQMRTACSIPKGTNTSSEYVTLIACHCNNGCTDATQCYVTRTLSVLCFCERACATHRSWYKSFRPEPRENMTTGGEGSSRTSARTSYLSTPPLRQHQ
jgi:hypothetical protein